MIVKDIWNRMGSIRMSVELMKSLSVEDAEKIFSRLIIIDIVNTHWNGSAIEYRCVSQSFEVVSEGGRIPEYLIVTTREEGKELLVKFEKVVESNINEVLKKNS